MSEINSVTIIPYASLPCAGDIAAELDAIFFEASAVRSFASPAARAAFRQLWLGDYLEQDAGEALLAIDVNGRLAGYLVGSLRDPARDERWASLGYFGELAPWTSRFPAHLHINLAPAYRSQGLGQRLISAFGRHAAEHGAPGMHVVTGQGLRNVRFYNRVGFQPLAQVEWNGRTLVMLGSSLERGDRPASA